jgi:hypothetical protein
MPQIRPFIPTEFRKNPDGTVSSEILITVQDPLGRWVNIPSLWMMPSGPVQLPEHLSARTAFDYEQRTHTQFPRFSKLTEAIDAARARSKAGGASTGSLASGVFGRISR